jgi:peptidoglycan/xylan/chitin deacetylase (PgdA/CDA1 family)
MEHILNRRDRFDDETLANLGSKNPYYNIPEFMAMEDKFGLRSTFFFRTRYEQGNYLDYEDDIRELIKGGWEVGLHSDPSSVTDLDKIKEEKTKLETLTRNMISANRVHYLGFHSELPHKLKELGFGYDSSTKKFKDRIDTSDMGYYYMTDHLIEFPITLMDAYLFTYMKVTEEKILQTFADALNLGRKFSPAFNILSVIWHDNVLKMKGGRMYPKILQYLVSQDDVKILRGADLVEIINKGN